MKQEIYLSLLPGKQYIESGVWKIVLTPGRIVDGEYQMWLPTQSSLNMGTAFLQPNSMSTLTIPSTASLAVTWRHMMPGHFRMRIFREGSGGDVRR